MKKILRKGLSLVCTVCFLANTSLAADTINISTPQNTAAYSTEQILAQAGAAAAQVDLMNQATSAKKYPDKLYYNSAGVLTTQDIYYQDTGKLNKRLSYASNGKISQVKEYSNTGKLVRRDMFDNYGRQTITIFYDSNGKAIQDVVYDAASGRLVSIKDTDHATTEVKTYYYNAAQVIYKRTDSTKYGTAYVDNYYDSTGQTLIKKEYYDSNKTLYKTEEKVGTNKWRIDTYTNGAKANTFDVVYTNGVTKTTEHCQEYLKYYYDFYGKRQCQAYSWILESTSYSESTGKMTEKIVNNYYTNDRESDGITPKLLNKTQTFYDKNTGIITEETMTNGKGIKYSHKLYSGGKLTIEESGNIDTGSIQSKILYSYNSSGQLIIKQEYDSTGALVKKTTYDHANNNATIYFYTANKLTQKNTQTIAGTLLSILEYNTNGDLIEATYYQGYYTKLRTETLNQSTNTWEVRYFSGTVVTKKEALDINKKVLSREEFSSTGVIQKSTYYDALGNVIRQILYYSNGNPNTDTTWNSNGQKLSYLKHISNGYKDYEYIYDPSFTSSDKIYLYNVYDKEAGHFNRLKTAVKYYSNGVKEADITCYAYSVRRESQYDSSGKLLQTAYYAPISVTEGKVQTLTHDYFPNTYYYDPKNGKNVYLVEYSDSYKTKTVTSWYDDFLTVTKYFKTDVDGVWTGFSPDNFDELPEWELSSIDKKDYKGRLIESTDYFYRREEGTFHLRWSDAYYQKDVPSKRSGYVNRGTHLLYFYDKNKNTYTPVTGYRKYDILEYTLTTSYEYDSQNRATEVSYIEDYGQLEITYRNHIEYYSGGYKKIVSYDQNNIRTSESFYASDGSGYKTEYYPSQQKSCVTEYYANFKTKRETRYNESGTITHEANYFEDGSIKESTTYDLTTGKKTENVWRDGNGNKRITSYSASGYAATTRIYENEKTLVKETLFDTYGKISRETTYCLEQSTRQEKLTSITEFSSGVKTKATFFDGSKYEIKVKEVDYFSSGSVQKETFYELDYANNPTNSSLHITFIKIYSSNGQLTEKHTYRTSPKNVSRITEYTNGKQTKDTYYNSNGSVASIYEYGADSIKVITGNDVAYYSYGGTVNGEYVLGSRIQTSNTVITVNGNIKTETKYTYINGVQVKSEETEYSNSIKTKHTEYKNGWAYEQWEYQSNGNVTAYRQYVAGAGSKLVTERTYYSTGRIKTLVNFDSNGMISYSRENYSNGTTYKEYYYENGKMTKYVYYYSSGSYRVTDYKYRKVNYYTSSGTLYYSYYF